MKLNLRIHKNDKSYETIIKRNITKINLELLIPMIPYKLMIHFTIVQNIFQCYS